MGRRIRGSSPSRVRKGQLLPAKTAGHAVATLARDSVAKHRRAWRIADAILARVPEWVDIIIRRALERESGT